MNKLFSFKVAKRAIIICMLLLVLLMIIISYIYKPKESSDGIPIFLGLLFGAFPYIAQEVFHFSLDTIVLFEDLSPFIVIITVIIEFVCYKSVISNYSNNDITLRHKISCILGLVALPIWTVITGYIFCAWGYYFSNDVLGILSRNGVIYKILSFIIMFVFFVIPTLCVFVYSLVLDIHGLRHKYKTNETKEAPL